MEKLLRIKNSHFIKRDDDGNILKLFDKAGLDLKAKVVCEPCNGGWMSDIENLHAKPALGKLILGDDSITISKSRADSIALFAFKTAVVVDHMRRERPFFRRSVRYEFRKSRTIPTNVNVWGAAFIRQVGGMLDTDYRGATVEGKGRIELYVCSYSIGHFVFQVVSAKYTKGIRGFSCMSGFEHLATPFWPILPQKVRWPPNNVIMSPDEFRRFGQRWRGIHVA